MHRRPVRGKTTKVCVCVCVCVSVSLRLSVCLSVCPPRFPVAGVQSGTATPRAAAGVRRRRWGPPPGCGRGTATGRRRSPWRGTPGPWPRPHSSGPLCSWCRWRCCASPWWPPPCSACAEGTEPSVSIPTHTHTHTQTHRSANTHTHTSGDTHTGQESANTHRSRHTHRSGNTHTGPETHTQVRKHTHTDTQTHRHTHTHTAGQCHCWSECQGEQAILLIHVFRQHPPACLSQAWPSTPLLASC